MSNAIRIRINQKLEMGNTCCSESTVITSYDRPASLIYKEGGASQQKPDPENALQTADLELTSNNNDQILKHEELTEKTIMLPDGSKYEGSTKTGIPHGQGTEYHINQDKYIGHFVEGVKEGKGRYEYANGVVYTGDFKEGDIEGVGRMEWPNGDWYEGGFRGNVMNGYGKYYSKESDSSYEGTYLDGKRHGKGTIVSKGNVLNGYWELGVFKFKKLVPYEPV